MYKILRFVLAFALVAGIITVPTSTLAADATRMNGIFDPYQTIKAIYTGTNVVWQIGDTEQGPWSQVGTGETYTITTANATKWIRFVVDGTQSDARQISPAIDKVGSIPSPDPVLPVNNLNSPVANVFKIGGDEFVLLDVTQSDESKFFIMTKGFYGDRSFGSYNEFQASDSIRIWLNSTSDGGFLKDGNTAGSTHSGNVKTKLPQTVMNQIDMNHVWVTEPRYPDWGGVTQVTTNGVALLSATELRKYCSKLGLVDGLDNTNNGQAPVNNYYGWWLRSANSKFANNENVLYVNSTSIEFGNVGGFPSSGSFAVRPVFYVGKDFFKNIAVDQATLGTNVIDAIVATYTAAEAEQIVGKSVATYISDITIKGIYEPSQTAEVSYSSDGELQISRQWQICDTADGTFTDIASQTDKTLEIGLSMAGRYIRACVTFKGTAYYTEARRVADALIRDGERENANTGWLASAPAENVFRVEGKDFVLLDTTESDSSKFYVIAKDLYGTHQWHQEGGQVYDATNIKSIAYWLNHDFLTDNNGFPQSIRSSINNSRVWRMEPRVWGDGNEYYTTAGVGLLAAYEYDKYISKIGVADGNSTVPGVGAFWLRTPLGAQYASGELDLCLNWSGRIVNGGATDFLAVRPAFYLDQDAFKNFKLQSAGKNVQDMIRQNYKRSELSAAGYSAQELVDLLGFDNIFEISGVTVKDRIGGIELNNIDDKTSIYVEANVLPPSEGSENVVVYTAVYSAGHKLVGMGLCSLELSAEAGGDVSMSVNNITAGIGNYIKIFVFSDLSSITPLTTAYELHFEVKMDGIFAMQNTITANAESASSIQWQARDTNTSKFADISGAKGTTYKVPNDMCGKWLRFVAVINGKTIYAPAKKIAAALTTMGDIPSVNPALSVVQATTPDENVFTVDGKQFILLDVTESSDSKFYVLTKDYYGNRKFSDEADGHLFMGTGSSIVRNWLNGDFLTSGNSGNTLPQSIIQKINMNQVWLTEPRDPYYGTSVVQVSTGGLGLLSLTELYNYCGKIGLSDGLDPGNGYYGWWTRTPQGTFGTNRGVILVKPGEVGATMTMNEDSGNAIRPSFYLKGDFFQSVKVTNPGINVKRAIIQNVTDEELAAAGYTAEEITDLHDIYDVQVQTNAKVLNQQGDAIVASATFHVENVEPQDFTVLYTINNGTPYTETISAKKNDVKDITISGIQNGTNMLNLSILRDGKAVGTFSQEIAVTVKTEAQFLNEFNYKGYVVGWPVPLDESIYDNFPSGATRQGPEWHGVETTKGVYNMDNYNWTAELKEYGTKSVVLFAYGNPLYSGVAPLAGGEENKYGPATIDEYEAFGNWVAYVAARLPDVKYFEIYNEPNILPFWEPTPSYADYGFMLSVVYHKVKAVRPDAVILGGATSDADEAYASSLYGLGDYAFMDSFSYHPYAYPNGTKTADGQGIVCADRIVKQTLLAGGFKEYAVTEVGWPTQLGTENSPSTERKQSIEQFKQVVLSDSYGVNVLTLFGYGDGPDKYNKEDNFGVFRYDGSPKPAALSGKYIMQKTAGAQYFGRLDLGTNMIAHVYIKDRKPFVVLWNTAGTGSYNFTGENITVQDMFGNVISNGTNVVLSDTPVVIDGVSNQWLNKSIAYTTEWYVKKFGAFVNQGSTTLFNTAIANAKAYANDTTLPSAADISAKLDAHYATASAILSSNISDIKVKSALLDILNKTGMMWAGMLAIATDSGESVSVSSTAQIANAKSALSAKISGTPAGSQVYTSSIIKQAEEYNEKAVKTAAMAYNPFQAGMVRYFDTIATKLAYLATAMSGTETVALDKLFMVVPSKALASAGTNKTVQITVYNYGNTKVDNVFINLYSNSGKIGSTAAFSIPAGGKTTVAATGINLATPSIFAVETSAESDYKYYGKIVVNGTEKKTQLLPLVKK